MNDERLIWLIEVFLKYFEDWKLSIDQRPGNSTKADWGICFYLGKHMKGSILMFTQLLI
jgi:hypothetical protein